jgi:dihydroxyacetone kinase-like protein
MSDAPALPAAEFRLALLAAGDRVTAARDDLCALDAAAGDGDLGATLATGFVHVREVLEADDGSDVGAMLVLVGRQLATKAPSTIGALLGTAFLRAGGRLAGVVEVRAADAAALLDAAAAGVAERGGAEAGQRTILDAMLPAAAAAERTAAEGGSATAAFEAAAAGARAGADATAGMEPQHGRAGWIADRARGTKDAGATAWATYLEGLAAGCRSGRTDGTRAGA